MNHLDESSLGLNENPYIIQLQNLTKVYDGVTVIDKRNMNIKKGEFVTILGPSGCGKSTTLRRIAGFETPDSGDILLNGKDITPVPPYKRQNQAIHQYFIHTFQFSQSIVLTGKAHTCLCDRIDRDI